MIQIQPNAGDGGLGYGVGVIDGDTFIAHSGDNPGWNACFILDVNRREGFVMANNSSAGSPLNRDAEKLWLKMIDEETKSEHHQQ
jgi:hypothetical protein